MIPQKKKKNLDFSLLPFSPYIHSLSRAAKSSQKFDFSYGAVSSQTENWQDGTKTEWKGILRTHECPAKTHHSHSLYAYSCISEFSCAREEQQRQDH